MSSCFILMVLRGSILKAGRSLLSEQKQCVVLSCSHGREKFNFEFRKIAAEYAEKLF